MPEEIVDKILKKRKEGKKAPKKADPKEEKLRNTKNWRRCQDFSIIGTADLKTKISEGPGHK